MQDAARNNVVELRPGAADARVTTRGVEDVEADNELANYIEKVETECSEAHARIESLCGANASLVDELGSVRSSLHEARTHVARLTSDNAALQLECEQMREAAKQLQADGVAAFAQAQADAREHGAGLVQQIEFERGRVHALETQLSTAQESIAETARLLRESREHADQLAVQSAGSAERVAQLEKHRRHLAGWLTTAAAALILVASLWPKS